MAFWDHDIRVARLVANGFAGGTCVPDVPIESLDRDAVRFASLAGRYGTNLNGEFDDQVSEADSRIYVNAGVLATRQRQWLDNRLSEWIWRREQEIRFVAAALESRGILEMNALAALVHDNDVLSEFRHLYHKPSPRLSPAIAMTPPKRASGGRIVRVTCSNAMQGLS